MITPPRTLPEIYKDTWDRLAPLLESMGTLREPDAEALGRYILISVEYAHISSQTVQAISAGDADATKAWLGMQDRLSKQLAEYETRFGLTAKSRKDNGWILPKVE